jgi:hypothetical protein
VAIVQYRTRSSQHNRNDLPITHTLSNPFRTTVQQFRHNAVVQAVPLWKFQCACVEFRLRNHRYRHFVVLPGFLQNHSNGLREKSAKQSAAKAVKRLAVLKRKEIPFPWSDVVPSELACPIRVGRRRTAAVQLHASGNRKAGTIK